MYRFGTCSLFTSLQEPPMRQPRLLPLRFLAIFALMIATITANATSPAPQAMTIPSTWLNAAAAASVGCIPLSPQFVGALVLLAVAAPLAAVALWHAVIVPFADWLVGVDESLA
jgi:hypothetical protein